MLRVSLNSFRVKKKKKKFQQTNVFCLLLSKHVITTKVYAGVCTEYSIDVMFLPMIVKRTLRVRTCVVATPNRQKRSWWCRMALQYNQTCKD